MSIYLQLFFAFFKIGLFSIGGGYAALPLIRDQIVEKSRWLDAAQFTDVVTISQMTPGPITINAATFVGIRVAGIAGAVCATIGSVLPSCIIVMILATLYKKYRELKLVNGMLDALRPAVVGLIASAGLSIVVTAIFGAAGYVDIFAIFMLLCGFILLRLLKPNPIAVMLTCGALGGVVYTLFPKI